MADRPTRKGFCRACGAGHVKFGGRPTKKCGCGETVKMPIVKGPIDGCGASCHCKKSSPRQGDGTKEGGT